MGSIDGGYGLAISGSDMEGIQGPAALFSEGAGDSEKDCGRKKDLSAVNTDAHLRV